MGTYYKTASVIIALAIAACTATESFAATLKTSSSITKDIITVSDVFEDTGEHAARFLAPAPKHGQAMTLNAHDLTRISNAFKLGWAAENTGAHLTIRRTEKAQTKREPKQNKVIIDRFSIEAAINEKISKEMNGQKFDMSFHTRALKILLPHGTKKTLHVENMDIDLQNNRFDITISAPAHDPIERLKVEGKIFALEAVPVLKKSIRKGDIISSYDIEYIDMRSSAITANMVLDAHKLIGKTPRRGITAMRPITPSDVVPPTIVKKGDIVTVTLKNGIMNLTMKARALENGAKGAAIRIINTSSNRTLEGTVTGPQTITVQKMSAAL